MLSVLLFALFCVLMIPIVICFFIVVVIPVVTITGLVVHGFIRSCLDIYKQILQT